LLAMFNPTAKIELDSDVIVLGGTLHVAWSMAGNARRLKHLRIYLQGEEESTYRRGTRTYTDRQTFAELDILDTADYRQMETGSTAVRVPVDMMHSFAATNNRIVWKLCVRGDIPRWPDVSDEYSIVLAPAGISGRV